MADHEATTPILSNTLYDVIKNAAQYWLPGAGALYFALAGIWGLPYAEQIIGTITAIDIFLGVVLGATKNSYKNSDAAVDGAVVLDPDTGIAKIELKSDTTIDKSVITLRQVDSQ